MNSMNSNFEANLGYVHRFKFRTGLLGKDRFNIKKIQRLDWDISSSKNERGFHHSL